MSSYSHRNATFAMVSGLRDILASGSRMKVRDQDVREIRNRLTVLQHPLERCIITPARNNNVFLAIAETFWVLAGRNDLEFLRHYSKKADSFSDDGLTWHGAYGPRLRRWGDGKTDQLKEVREVLLKETLSRRAVMSLFDPGQDFRIEGKDIPCNNWLHWLIRDGRLHLNIAVRSNDVVWGFSGINTFEFSVLHEMMAFWLGVPVGEVSFFASSFHLYDRHYEVAPEIVDKFPGFTCYECGISAPAFNTPWDDFDKALARWFLLEAEIRSDPFKPIAIESELSDPLMTQSLSMLQLYNRYLKGDSAGELKAQLAKMPETDFTAAAFEFIGRKHPEVSNQISQSTIASYFERYKSRRDVSLANVSLAQLICSLHKRKDAAYGNSWKKRGEQVSILANIARKVDRLGIIATTNISLKEESSLDTAIDLFVYAIKYCLFILESDPKKATELLEASSPTPLSDYVEHFDKLVARFDLSSASTRSLAVIVQEIEKTFDDARIAADQGVAAEQRLTLALQLSSQAAELVSLVASMDQTIVREMWEREVKN